MKAVAIFAGQPILSKTGQVTVSEIKADDTPPNS